MSRRKAPQSASIEADTRGESRCVRSSVLLTSLSYSGKEIPDLEENINTRIHDLMKLIKQESAEGKAIDFAKVAQYFTLDVLTEIAFEKPFGFLTQNTDVFEYIGQVSAFLHILELCCNFPMVQKIVSSRFMAGARPKPTDKTGLGAMLGIAQGVVKKRYASGAKDREDMLGSFKKNGLTMEEAEGESMLQILAGSDSTATAIRMVFLYVLTAPSVYAKLTREIRAYATSPITKASDARAMPYLQSCIKEGLRMWPPLAGLLTKAAPEGGETFKGTFIPSGIEVCWSPFSMLHRKDVFGPDADVFRPERWLEAADDSDKEALAKMDRTLDLVFGSGKYGCLGKTVALLELDKIFVTLLYDFDWAVVDPVTPIRTRCHGVHVQTDLWLKASPRRAK
jgi:cytochrome P450